MRLVINVNNKYALIVWSIYFLFVEFNWCQSGGSGADGGGGGDVGGEGSGDGACNKTY